MTIDHGREIGLLGAAARCAGIAVAAVLALLACSSRAWAAVDTVTSLSGSATTPGSLGYEIANASSGDSIVFQNGLSGTITLSSAITVSQDLTITGPGAGQLAVSGGGQSQIFDVTAPTVSVSGLTVTDAAGGAVIVNPSVPGSLTVSAMTFSDDTASGGDGGAIDQESGVETITVAGSTFTDDAASFGGAIWDEGSLISVSNSIFTRDSATNDGGVYYSEEGSALHVSGSSFTQDSAGGDGGAINNSQETWVSGSTFSGDSAGASGGGEGGALVSNEAVVSSSTFSGDSAGADGSGQGGAIEAEIANVSSSTFSGDSAGANGSGQGGALVGSGTVIDSTLTGNSAGEGGAIDALGGMTLTSDTLDENAAAGAGSAIDGADKVTAVATIVADNTGAPDCDAPVASSSFSLEGPAGSVSCGFDLTSAEPDLGSLQGNGGPTATQALPASSPAVDVIPAADCPAADAGVDQRGEPRPAMGAGYCDVGAFELQDGTQTSLSCPAAAVALGAGSPGCAAMVTAADAPEAGTPAWQVVYRVYSDAGCSVTAAGGQTVVLGSGGSVPAFSPSMVAAGGWYVQATFAPAVSGAAFGLQASTSPCVALSIAPATVTVSSTVQDLTAGTPWSAGGEPAGSSAQDSATLGATVAAFPATGKLTYALYDDGTCTGTPASTQTVTVNAGSVPSSAATGALNAGAYGYLATYSGDANYTPPSTTTCEPFTVTASVANRADLQIAISGPASAGDGATFAEKVAVTNLGPATAKDVVTALIAPPGVTIANPGGSSVLGSVLDWTATAIAAHATTTYTVSFKVAAHTSARAVIAVATASLQTPDPNYANNAATTTITLGTVTGHTAPAHPAHDPLALGRALVARLRALEHDNHRDHRSTNRRT